MLVTEVGKDETSWTSKVTVAEKTVPRTAARSPTKHQTLILIDSEVYSCFLHFSLLSEFGDPCLFFFPLFAYLGKQDTGFDF